MLHSTLSTATRSAVTASVIALSAIAAPWACADVVQATLRIQADDFQASNLQPPPAPTSSSFDGIITVTFNSAVFQTVDIVPDALSGFEITANDGSVTVYDAASAAVNARRFAADDKLQLTIGGTTSGVAFMAGISNDFRVIVDLSLNDFSVLGVAGDFTFVTTSDPFYTAQITSVTLIDLDVIPDSDNDTLVDNQDNCIDAANPDQRDTDGDGIGNRCDADFNQDCIVNVLDLGRLRDEFFMSGDLDTDLDGDGSVNVTDLGIVRSLFFQSPGPSGTTTFCQS